MSDQEIRNYLRNALALVVDAEKVRVAKILDDSEKKFVQGVEKMKPLLTLISALKDEVGDINGLDISISKHGHMATVRTQTSITTKSLSISTNYENTAFEIDEFNSCSLSNSCSEDKKEYAFAEEVMVRVINLVGEHIGGQKGQEAYKNI